MLVAYFLMHLTFVSLYLNMRKLGSRFWLGKPIVLLSSLTSQSLFRSIFGSRVLRFWLHLLSLRRLHAQPHRQPSHFV